MFTIKTEMKSSSVKIHDAYKLTLRAKIGAMDSVADICIETYAEDKHQATEKALKKIDYLIKKLAEERARISEI
jgi:hypothetical protein